MAIAIIAAAAVAAEKGDILIQQKKKRSGTFALRPSPPQALLYSRTTGLGWDENILPVTAGSRPCLIPPPLPPNSQAHLCVWPAHSPHLSSPRTSVPGSCCLRGTGRPTVGWSDERPVRQYLIFTPTNQQRTSKRRAPCCLHHKRGKHAESLARPRVKRARQN